MSTLIIAEKPQAAKRIAYALSEGKPKQKKSGSVSYYRFKRNDKDVTVAPAVGHLYMLSSDEKGYPVLNPEWEESHSVNKSSKFSKKYLEALKKLSKKADELVNACDYDLEGAVIGFNIVRFACKKKDAKRMKFSTLTKSDLVSSYKNVLPHQDSNQVEAGLTRHYLDYFWGISASRALIQSIQKHGKRFQILSTGRVQGPTLSLLADREKEISDFKPKSYWEVELEAGVDSQEIVASHKKGRFWKKKDARGVVDKCKDKPVKVDSVKTSRLKINPPFPFDLTSLQTEAYRKFGFRPSVTLSVAQDLYSRALISYPRTSSQKLPAKIGYKAILKKLSKQSSYTKIASEIASKTRLKPVQGKKTDPAHPAIYPTGVSPKSLSSYQKKLYDLVVRRFFAVFGDPAFRKKTMLSLEVRGEEFKASGVRTVDYGWLKYYKYRKYSDQELPEVKEGQKLKNQGLKLLSKKTKPPKRYSQASIIREMEKKGLGTKATRSRIVKTLYDRRYIRGKKIKVTTLGYSVVKALKKYAPDVVSVELTRKFEESTEKILKGKKDMEQVLQEAKKKIKKISKDFKKNEKEIGKTLSESIAKTKREESLLGPCPKCGKDLRLLYSKKNNSRFVGCSGYPKCHNMYPVPKKGRITPTKKVCKICGTPIIRVKRKGKRPFEMCLDTECETKKDWGKKS